MGPIRFGYEGASTVVIHEYRIYEATNRAAMPTMLKVIEASMPAFERAGMRVVGCWTPGPISNSSTRVIYMLEFRDLAHLEQAWAAYFADPEVTTTFMELTGGDFSWLRTVNNYLLEPTNFSPTV